MLQETRNLDPNCHLSFLETLTQSRSTAETTMSTGPTGKEKKIKFCYYNNYYLSFRLLLFYEV